MVQLLIRHSTPLECKSSHTPFSIDISPRWGEEASGNLFKNVQNLLVATWVIFVEMRFPERPKPRRGTISICVPYNPLINTA